jgi:hypothetical protein
MAAADAAVMRKPRSLIMVQVPNECFPKTPVNRAGSGGEPNVPGSGDDEPGVIVLFSIANIVQSPPGAFKMTGFTWYKTHPAKHFRGLSRSFCIAEIELGEVFGDTSDCRLAIPLECHFGRCHAVLALLPSLPGGLSAWSAP